MALICLRHVCGARAGDKDDRSDVSLFADDPELFVALRRVVTAERVKAHFGQLVQGDVERFEAANVLALKFVLHGALGGGAQASLRSDSMGKAFGMHLLRMEVELPDRFAGNRYRRPRPPAAPRPHRSSV
jgi:hypothetical protein